MARYIDAENLRDDVDRTLNWNTNNEYNMYSDVMDMIDNAPTEDVQPVARAKWEIDEAEINSYVGSGYIETHCSNCSYGVGFELGEYNWGCDDNYDIPFKFCPHCGAKMDKE